MGRELPEALDHDSVWSFIRGADEVRMRIAALDLQSPPCDC